MKSPQLRSLFAVVALATISISPLLADEPVQWLHNEKYSPGHYFGRTLALNKASQKDLLVGATKEAGNAGRVYSFTPVGETWKLHQEIKADDTVSGDCFGGDIDISGNYAIIAAGGKNGGNGAAYIFEKQQGVWNQVAKFEPFGTCDFVYFYGKVAIDKNGWAAVGAVGDDTLSDNAGAVYLYRRQNGAWSFHSKITAFDGEEDHFFGGSVALSGSTLVVGAPHYDVDPDPLVPGILPYCGAIYTYQISNNTVELENHILLPDPHSSELFGYNIALDQDTLAVGVPKSDNGKGAVHVYKRVLFGLFDKQPIPLWFHCEKIENSESGENFGFSVDVDAESGFIIAGTPWETVNVWNGQWWHGLSYAGSATVIKRHADSWNWSKVTTLHASSGPAPNDFFGAGVAIAAETVAVGYPGDNKSAGSVDLIPDIWDWIYIPQ